MKKYTIRKNHKKTILQVFNEKKGKDLVIIVHGLGGFKEQPHIQLMADVFKRHNYTVLIYDACYSIGESSGSLLNATLTRHYQCLNNVIKWTKQQSWYKQPFILVGHSLGSAACILYAEKNPNDIKAIAPTSAFISGKEFKKSIIRRGVYYA